jgi:hypothetical protein
MDWQEMSALAVVAAVCFLWINTALKRRAASPPGGVLCRGCGQEGSARATGSITVRGRRGQPPVLTFSLK